MVSHVLPPTPSGQSVLLERLLRDVDPASCCLINTGREHTVPAAGGLAGSYYRLGTPLRIPVREIPVVCWLPLLLNALWGIFSRARQIVRIVRQEDCDLLIGCTGDLYDLPATWLASRWTGRPFIAYIMDDYIYQWTGFRRWMASRLEPRFIAAARRVFVLNEFVRRWYAKRYGIEPVVIHNPVQLPDLEQLDRIDSGANCNQVNIVYTGSIYHAHFDAFCNLIEVLRSFDPERVRLHIYTAQSKDSLEQKGIGGPSVIYHSHIPQKEVVKVLRQADILFLPLAFESPIPEVIQTSAPFKTSEYLAAGRPILVHAPEDSFLSWYFSRHSCGMVVDRNDRQLLKEALLCLLENEGLRQDLAAAARRQAEADFDIRSIRPKFISQLSQVAASSAG